MIRSIRRALGAALYWIDLCAAGVVAAIGVASIYGAFYAWSFTKAFWRSLNFPVSHWQDPMMILNWGYQNASIELAILAGKAWGGACLTGFLAMAGGLALHDALVRVRVRLG